MAQESSRHLISCREGSAPTNVSSWLQADIQSPEIEVCFSPNNGHSPPPKTVQNGWILDGQLHTSTEGPWGVVPAVSGGQP